MILGIDEVGRGPWAGPLVVGAVVLGGAAIEGLTDSKKLTKKRREELDFIIRQQASGYGLGWVTSTEIDEIGLSASLVLATKRAVEQVDAPYHEIIIDGTVNFLKETTKGKYVTTMKKADLLIPSVSAASIIAKVARDAYMAEQSLLYPEYGFGSHVGYGTAAHSEAIKAHGVTPLHRLSFEPLRHYRTTGQIIESVDELRPVSSTEIGNRGEDEVVHYLRKRGHAIRERNWKTTFCEIDIISEQNGTLYFTEVKYRKNTQQGGGILAITPKKLKQMKFAARYYVLKTQTDSYNLELAGASVSGNEFIVDEWVTVL